MSKTYMTRVDGENTRLRHYSSAVAPQNLMLLQVSGDAEVFITPTAPLFEVSSASSTSLIHYTFSNARRPRAAR